MKDFVLTPVVLDCTLRPWQKTLPPIIGENKDNKVTFKINLGKAASFLSYLEYERMFELIPETAEPDLESHS